VNQLQTLEEQTLYIFIDESGNFDFSSSGTTYFVMAALSALRPVASASVLHQLRYAWLASGEDISSFHASEDKQAVRDSVFKSLKDLRNLNAHVIYGEKKLTMNKLQNIGDFYILFAESLISHMLKIYNTDEYQKVVIILDQALPKRKENLFLQSVKPELKRLGKPFYIYFQRMVSDANGQIADYVAWAKYVQLTRNEVRPWNALSESISPTEFDIFCDSS
jgi:hypothetical protein